MLRLLLIDNDAPEIGSGTELFLRQTYADLWQRGMSNDGEDKLL